MQSFSNILYNLLKQKGISQRMLAEMANTTEATISRYWTNARRMPRADLVSAIAEALNVEYRLSSWAYIKPGKAVSFRRK